MFIFAIRLLRFPPFDGFFLFLTSLLGYCVLGGRLQCVSGRVYYPPAAAANRSLLTARLANAFTARREESRLKVSMTRTSISHSEGGYEKRRRVRYAHSAEWHRARVTASREWSDVFA